MSEPLKLRRQIFKEQIKSGLCRSPGFKEIEVIDIFFRRTHRPMYVVEEMYNSGNAAARESGYEAKSVAARAVQ